MINYPPTTFLSPIASPTQRFVAVFIAPRPCVLLAGVYGYTFSKNECVQRATAKKLKNMPKGRLHPIPSNGCTRRIECQAVYQGPYNPEGRRSPRLSLKHTEQLQKIRTAHLQSRQSLVILDTLRHRNSQDLYFFYCSFRVQNASKESSLFLRVSFFFVSVGGVRHCVERERSDRFVMGVPRSLCCLCHCSQSRSVGTIVVKHATSHVSVLAVLK